jgi:hypothetical protein
LGRSQDKSDKKERFNAELLLARKRESGKMNAMEASEKKDNRKPGPVPGPPTRKCNVLIEEELADWGKQQPGGLSELIRRLLKAERHKQEQEC